LKSSEEFIAAALWNRGEIPLSRDMNMPGLMHAVNLRPLLANIRGIARDLGTDLGIRPLYLRRQERPISTARHLGLARK
jgi:hypothetical protein